MYNLDQQISGYNHMVSGSYAVDSLFGVGLNNINFNKPIVENKVIEDPIVTIESWVTAPRWAKVETFLRKLCMEYGLYVDITNDGGWISITNFFKITGTKSQVNLVIEILGQACLNYNR